jgi:enterochelin esterase-like enzyme
MSRMASGIEIPDKDGGFYALKDVPHGDIRIKRYLSKASNTWRDMYVYTPPGYDKSTDKYPVLYLLHGGGEDQRGWGMQGKTDLILDNLIAEGKAKPMVIAMLDGNMGGAGGRAGFNENVLRAFENEIKMGAIPFVENNFRVETDAKNRALAGLSMGGLQTLYAGIKNTDLFSSLGVFSSGWFANNPALTDPQYAFMKTNASTINSNLKQLWISMGGKEDIAYQNCQIMMKKFDEMGIKYSYSEYAGGHTWPSGDTIYSCSHKCYSTKGQAKSIRVRRPYRFLLSLNLQPKTCMLLPKNIFSLITAAFFGGNLYPANPTG